MPKKEILLCSVTQLQSQWNLLHYPWKMIYEHVFKLQTTITTTSSPWTFSSVELKVLLKEGQCHYPFADEENEAQEGRDFATAISKWTSQGQIHSQVHSVLRYVTQQT